MPNKYISKLANSRVLVIGGSSGIGYGVAEALIEYSAAYVAISSSNPSRVDKAISQLKSAYPDSKTKLQGVACNLGDQSKLESNIKNLFSSLDLNGDKLDHIVYTAGDALAAKPISEVDLGFAIQAGMVRFFGPLIVAKHAPQYLKPGPESSITLTTGSVSEKPIPDWSVVGSFATGLHGMTRGLALDLKPIRVNLISPGAVETELWDGLSQEQKEGLFEGVRKGTTTGKVGRVVDVVEGYLGLMKDGNASGTCWRTDGGHLVM